MKIDTTYLERCIATLDKAQTLLKQSNPENIDYDMYRSACIKHDYGVNFAEETLVLLPQFITDATDLAAAIQQQNNN